MKQVTAVEWLIEQISSSKYFYNLMEEIESRSTIVQPNVLQQANKMHEQQIIDAYKQGQFDGDIIRDTDAEQYYNQTYKEIEKL
jgi:hypothetical protein